MFHRKPLYVSFAQRKEERQAQLQLQYARVTGLQGSSSIFPGRYPPIYYPAHGIAPPVPVRPGLVYQPLGMRPSWRAKGFVNSTRPTFQTSPIPMVSPHHHSLFYMFMLVNQHAIYYSFACSMFCMEFHYDIG